MGFGNFGTLLISGVFVVVIAVVAFRIFPTIQNATDELYLLFRTHCEVDGNKYTRIYAANADGTIASLALELGGATSDATCGTSALTVSGQTADGDALDEHGVKLGTFTSATAITIAGAMYIAQLDITKPFGALSRLILATVPIVSVVGFLTLSAVNLYQYNVGSMGLAGTIGYSIAGLLLVVIALELAPTIIDSANGAYMFVAADRLRVMELFGGIIRLVMQFIPVVFVAGVLALQGITGLFGLNRGRSGSMM